MPLLDEAVVRACHKELEKYAFDTPEPYSYTPEASQEVHRRFGELSSLLRSNGVFAGTGHKRIVIPKDKLTEKDIHHLGFTPVTIAIPEAGQDQFSSYRHPDMNFHIHSHPEGWTMHEDQHAAATMLARKAQGVVDTTKALASGIPHINEEGIPGLYYYAKGLIGGHSSTAQRVLSEMPDPLKQRIGEIAPSPTFSTEKSAGPRLGAMLGAGGAAGGVGTVAGGLIGAGAGGLHGYHEAREQGSDRLHSALQGLSGAVVGASRGSLAGQVLGGGLGAAVGGINPAKGEAFRKALGSLPGSHFGQRQVHGVTGWTPSGGVKEIGLGAAAAQPAVDAAKKRLQQARAGEGDLGFFEKARGLSLEDAAKKQLVAARAARMSAAKAERMGLTSLPGYGRSLRDNGVVATLGTALKDEWRGSSPEAKAMLVGMPAVGLTNEVFSKDEPDEFGRSKGSRIGSAVASTAGGLFLSPMPYGAQVLVEKGFGRLGQAGGTMVDRLRSRRQPPPMSSIPHDLVSDSGQAVPGERVISDRAGGNIGVEGSPAW